MAKTLTAREMASQLKQMGHQVTIYVRKDGGILITSIDGRKFKGAEGNWKARNILGQALSGARAEQTKMATEHKQKIAEGKLKRPSTISNDLETMQRRINRKRRKNTIMGGGIITKSKISWYLRNYGYDATIEMLEQQEAYAEGYAYLENVKHIIKKFQDLLALTGDSAYQECLDLIESKKKVVKRRDGTYRVTYLITDEEIWHAQYDIFNALDSKKLKSGREALSMLKGILKAR